MNRFWRAEIGLLILALPIAAWSVAARGDSRDEVSPLLVRAQLAKWPVPTTNPPPRIERNESGQVVLLRLDGVELEPLDIVRIRSFRQLKGLSLNHTSITDRELEALADLPHLRGLTLNYTTIGNSGVASLARFKHLKSVCLLKIHASPEAVRKLKLERRDLQIGYSPLSN